MGYGYAVEPPDERLTEFGTGNKFLFNSFAFAKKLHCIGPKLKAQPGMRRMFRAEASYAVRQDKWYFEFQVHYVIYSCYGTVYDDEI